MRGCGGPPGHYVAGRRVLIGDAAHAMTPDLGQGANQGLDDAAVLARCLRPIIAEPRGTRIDAALHRYDAARRPRSQTVARQARLLGRVMQASGTAATVRDIGMRLIPSAAASAASARMQDGHP